MERRKPSEPYTVLLQRLESELEPKDVDEAIKIANQIKTIIIKSAKGTTRGQESILQRARRLTSIMFNKFDTDKFDEIITDIQEVQIDPFVFREPHQVEYLED
jgi:hypothetical protein